jgi:outer membrane lipoprotein-sorting protein
MPNKTNALLIKGKSFINGTLLSVFCLLLPADFPAQMPKETVDAKAKAILDDLSAKTKTYTSIKAEFSYVNEGKDKKVTETQSGSLIVKGKKYRLEFKGQTVISDGTTQWTYIKEDNSVQINNAPDPSTNDNINPVNIFTIYEKGFKYEYKGEESQAEMVHLYPLQSDKKAYHTVKLWIDKVKKQIRLAKIVYKNGTSATITLTNFTANSEIPDTTFAFNKADYKGVEVIDLRDK